MGVQPDRRRCTQWIVSGVLALAIGLLAWQSPIVVAARASQVTPAKTGVSSESFDELYRKGQLANAGVKTLTARFTETTTSPLLTRPLVARGTLAVERPSRVMMRYDDPEPRVILIDGDRMTMTWPSKGLRQVLDIGRTQGRVQKYFGTSTAAELRKEFDIEPRERSERAGLTEVSMVPRRRQIKETLARLDLWVDPSTALLGAMRMTFAGGDIKLMEFHDVVPNAALPSDTFSAPR